MKVVLFNVHGGTEVLQYTDFPNPNPAPGYVLVRLHAAALNRMDLWVRNGWPGIKLEYPHIPGADGAGEVAGLGEGVNRWKVGDKVVINSSFGCGHCDFCLNGQDNLCLDWHLLGETIRGTYGEYVTVPERQLFNLPDGFNFHAAAAAALVFHTAWHSLVTRGKVQPGETVLIVGASGGVNTACIQVAKYLGAKIIVVGAGKDKLSLAEMLGADEIIDRIKEEDWSKAVYRLTDKHGVDIVVDNVGTTFPLSFRSLRKGGRLLTVGNTGGAKFEIDNRFIFSKHLSIIGSTMGTLGDFEKVMRLICNGKLNAVIDKTFPLSKAGLAQERLEKGKQLGKITLNIC